ncbi:Speckle-type POZ protein [Araneus ventricosus]|uniref:Speckle-type POZ protein n=1 Tax=Araneus ventricosus TaxID=182803 RepID=A0A4Y2T4G3_ARAVE|nr:Speckle-type POZ protein [Araneus ventricosus]GBN94319.1 Speckle-type POZ protein [Araneus ventricosus]
MANERKEYTFLWFIENYSYCWHDNGEKLVSPDFTPHGLEGTSWNLRLYPRGNTEESKSKISLFLARSQHDAGPEKFPLKYELSVIAADGSPLKSTVEEYTFAKGLGYGDSDFLCMDEVLLRGKSECLPQGTLNVRCRMWLSEGSIQKAGKYTARTRIGIEKISFLHKVENFSALKPNEKNTVRIQSHSKTRCVISSSLYFTDSSCCEDKVMVEIVCSDSKYILRKQKLSLLNGSEDVIECGEADIRFDAIKTDIQKLPLSLTREIILDRKSEYLPNDELSLICECAFSTGIEFAKIEETQHELPVAVFKQICKNARNKDRYNAAEKLSACTSASEDMKAIYVNQCLTDVVLKTESKTFPAHKSVLCARSSVFKAMLTNDMKEKNTDCIQVDDLEDDTVKQLLLFLYSDNLESLQWESAIKLYYVGDRYAIEKLKVLCSSFLVDNLGISSASELLLLADTHSDSDLKNFVDDFVLKHKEQIIDSDEWKNLEKTHPQLAMRTMYLMVKGKTGGK